jgi:hypothetical protein
MIRTLVFTAALAGLFASSSRADVEIASPPREVRADGSRDAAPDMAAPEDPAVTVDRIIKNSKAVGDKLAGTDTGKATQSTQNRILKDIESLINMQNDSSSKSGGDSSDKDKNQKNSDKNSGKKSDGKDPSGGMKNQQPEGRNQPMGGTEPKNDKNQQAKGGHRPRKGSGQPKDSGSDKDSGMAAGSPKDQEQGPMPGGGTAGGAGPGPNKNAKAGAIAGNPMGPAKTAQPTLPINEEVVKEVWGHLPDKLRQQVTQYYREQFMPKYADLLKQYYSSLANTLPRMP